MKIDSVIEQLYFAQRDYYTILKTPQEYRDKLESIMKYEFELTAALSAELLDLYNKVNDLNEEIQSIAMRYFYKAGFKAGFKISVESLT